MAMTGRRTASHSSCPAPCRASNSSFIFKTWTAGPSPAEGCQPRSCDGMLRPAGGTSPAMTCASTNLISPRTPRSAAAKVDRRLVRQERLGFGLILFAATPWPLGCRRWELVRLLRRLQREWIRIMASGEFDQRLDPGLDRRMRGEQIGETLAGVVDAHFHHRLICGGELAAALDLAQRGDHGVGVFGELNRACIGEIFAFA
jgi:hypothetical protein